MSWYVSQFLWVVGEGAQIVSLYFIFFFLKYDPWGRSPEQFIFFHFLLFNMREAIFLFYDAQKPCYEGVGFLIFFWLAKIGHKNLKKVKITCCQKWRYLGSIFTKHTTGAGHLHIVVCVASTPHSNWKINTSTNWNDCVVVKGRKYPTLG